MNTAIRLLNTSEAAARLGMSKSWLEKSRLTGDGPPFISMGGRRLYAVADLDAWIAACRRTSTSEPMGKFSQ